MRVLRRMTPLSMTSRRSCGRGIRVRWPCYWLGGVGPAAMTRGCICRESVRWRGVCGPPSLECFRRGSCRRYPAPRVHPRRWGRSTTVRWSAHDAERPRGSVAARGRARARVGVESREAEAVRKVHFERLVRRLGWTEDLPTEVSPRGAERYLWGGARAGRREDRRWSDVSKQNRAAPNQAEWNVKLPSGVPSTILAARRLFSRGSVGTSARLVEDDVRFSE